MHAPRCLSQCVAKTAPHTATSVTQCARARPLWPTKAHASPAAAAAAMLRRTNAYRPVGHIRRPCVVWTASATRMHVLQSATKLMWLTQGTAEEVSHLLSQLGMEAVICTMLGLSGSVGMSCQGMWGAGTHARALSHQHPLTFICSGVQGNSTHRPHLHIATFICTPIASPL